MNMFKRLKPKIAVSITIDEELCKKLKEIKEKNGVVSLSPMINEMLWDWIKKQEKKKDD